MKFNAKMFGLFAVMLMLMSSVGVAVAMTDSDSSVALYSPGDVSVSYDETEGVAFSHSESLSTARNGYTIVNCNAPSGVTVSVPNKYTVVIAGTIANSGVYNFTFDLSGTSNYSFDVTINVDVSSVSVTGVSVSPDSLTVAVGQSNSTATATVTPGDATNKIVAWSSSNPNIANVNVSSGVITGVAVGSATITATTADGSFTDTIAVTVSAANVPVTGISLDQSSKSIYIGNGFQLNATVSPSNATNQSVVWSSSNTSVASVSGGYVSGIAAGTATITATANGNFIASCTVVVKSAQVSVTGVSLDQSSLSLYAGGTSSLVATIAPANATNTSVSWTSSNPSVATVNAGVVTALSIGTSTITAISSDGSFTATCSVSVLSSEVAVTSVVISPSTASGASGATPVALSATVYPSNATNKSLTWTSSNVAVATVDSTGKISFIATGTATITARAVNGVSGTCAVTVTSGTVSESIVNVTGVTITPGANISAAKVGNTQQFTATIAPATATEKGVSWYSSNNDVCTVTQTGLMTCVGVGTATIYAVADDGGKTDSLTVTVTDSRVAVTAISVTPDSDTLLIGESVQCVATITPSTATNPAVAWSSSDTSVAIVSSSGFITGVATGSATITATTADGTFTDTVSITVGSTNAIAVTKIEVTGSDGQTSGTIVKGQILTLSATVTPVTATNAEYSWVSLNESIATVTSGGVVTALGVGEVTISAITTDGGKIGNYILTVTENADGTVTVDDDSKIQTIVDWINANITMVALAVLAIGIAALVIAPKSKRRY